MKNFEGYLLIFAGVILAGIWLIWGYSIFFDPTAFDYSWARGELGDYIGGGLGGITVLFIVYTVWLQIGQINSQQNESFEAGVFRMFQALKPELEGLSARIVSKAIKAKVVSTKDEEDFSVMLQKFQAGDRTVFLRKMQKPGTSQALRSQHNDEALSESISRFNSIMELLDKSLEETVKNDDDDFAKAIKATEIFAAYNKCFKEV